MNFFQEFEKKVKNQKEKNETKEENPDKNDVKLENQKCMKEKLVGKLPKTGRLLEN